MMQLLSCRYNMDTNRVEARFADGSAVAIDCIAIEDEYGNTPAQRAELDWLLYNKPLEYAQMVLGGEMEHYLSLRVRTRQAGRLTVNFHKEHDAHQPMVLAISWWASLYHQNREAYKTGTCNPAAPSLITKTRFLKG